MEKILEKRKRQGLSPLTPDQVRAVVEGKHAEWMGDPKMEIHLKPGTIFRPSNFLRSLDDLGEDDGTGGKKVLRDVRFGHVEPGTDEDFRGSSADDIPLFGD